MYYNKIIQTLKELCSVDQENNLIRVNIRISKKIKEYFENKSANTGVAQSALMALALEEYIDQKQTVNFFGGLDPQQFNEFMKKDNK